MRFLTIGFLVCLGACSQTSDTTPDSMMHLEQHRPQFHFSPAKNWMNDPNGMVYHNGQYHLFYQYYPQDTVWGPMHWGHAVSTDMLTWQHKPVALFPDKNGWIFSGSAVFDRHNTSGLGSQKNPPLVAVFTYHNEPAKDAGSKNFQTQGLAYSLDNGESWQKYDRNPVLVGPDIPDFRDPKVFWHDSSQKWIMTLAVQNRVSFYSSPNLKDWQHESDFGITSGTHAGVWECPDLIKMPVQGTNQEKYVLLVSINPGGPNGGSATQYFVGDFDGKAFVLDERFAQDVQAQPADFPAGTLFADFEKPLSNEWVAEGEAFKSPVFQPYKNQFPGLVGNRLLNSMAQNEEAFGTLTSPEFVIEQDFINFQITGGNNPQKVGMQLFVDGQAVLTATGRDTEIMGIVSWNVEAYQGKKAHFKFYDKGSRNRGYLVVDQIVFADRPAYNPKEGAVWLDYGTDNYAGVSWSNIPSSDGRTLTIGWMSNWLYAQQVPTEKWRSAMTLPRELTLHKTQQGYRVFSNPVKEVASLRQKSHYLARVEVDKPVVLSELTGISVEQAEYQVSLLPEEASLIELSLSNQLNEYLSIRFNLASQQLEIDRSKAGKVDFRKEFSQLQTAPLAPQKAYQLQMFFDHASVEIFINDGETVMTSVMFPNQNFSELSVSADKPLQLKDVQAWSLKSIF